MTEETATADEIEAVWKWLDFLETEDYEHMIGWVRRAYVCGYLAGKKAGLKEKAPDG